MRQLLNRFKKWKEPVIFEGQYIGKFKGNILEAVAQFFPEPHSTRILNEPSLNTHWKVYECILWGGVHTFRFYTKPAICVRVYAVLEQVYEAHHKDIEHPNEFDGRVDGLPLIYESQFMPTGCFVIWKLGQVQVEQSS